MFSNTVLMSTIQYALPMIYNETDKVKQTAKKSIMKCARYDKGSYCFKQSISKICKSLNWKTPAEIIDESAAKVTLKIINKKTPKTIFKKMKPPRTRKNATMGLIKYPTGMKAKANLINNMHKIYNRIPPELRELNQKIFKRKLKKMNLLPPTQ